jgi:hypothetical protein
MIVFGGLDLPIIEFLSIITLLLLAALVFILMQMRTMNRHMKVLEDTTMEIKRSEDEETDTVRRFETDMQKLESEEAELFVTKVVPTVSKLENFVAVELLKGRDPAEIQAAIVKKGISAELATRVVNSMTYYMDFFHKLPDKKWDAHVDTVAAMKVKQN